MPACTVTSSARGRLVGDDQVGLAGQRDRDEHALQHAAGELVRVLAQLLGGSRDVHLLAAVRRRALLGLGLGQLRWRSRIASGICRPMVCTRAERRHRVLRDERDVRPRTLPMRLGSAMTSSPPIAAVPGEHGEVVGQQPQHAHRRRRLAGAGLADDGHRLALVDGEADAVDGADDAGVGDQLDLQVA